MALNIVYPTPAAFKEIDADLVLKVRADRVGLQLFPVESPSTFNVRWIQQDNYFGLMQMRGMDGQPPRVQRIGQNSFMYEPGVFGEHELITEREILTRAIPGRSDIPIDASDLVASANKQLMNRLDARMEASVWSLMTTGTLSIPLPGPNGVQIYSDTYPIQTFTAAIPWNLPATATPLINLQQVQQLSIGHGVSFGTGAVAYMNQFTANLLLNNSNAADFGGRRSQYGSTLNSIAMFTDYMQAQNLPSIQVVDDGYQRGPLSGPITNASLQFVKFIPDHIIVVVGKRQNGARIGAFQQVLQAMQMGPAQTNSNEYSFVKNYANGINAPVEVPPRLEVHRGFNGGPTIFYPSAIVTMTV